MPKLSQRTAKLTGSPIRKMAPLAMKATEEGKTVYHLNIGQPDIPTPRAFMDGVRQADIDVLSYSPSRGLPKTLEALRNYYADNSLELSSTELCVTIGGSEAFTFALQATLDPGEEVIIPEPFYPNYLGNSQLAGIKVVPLTTHAENGFRLPDVREIEEAITPRTRAILFSNPGNPTGVLYTEKELARIVELALKHDLFVISDEVYREYVYEGKAISILSFPELSQHAILVDSISKRISACGARIGTIASRNKDLMATITKMAQSRLSPPTLSQLGLAAFLSDKSYKETINTMINKFHSRRDAMYKAVRGIPGVICRRPAGAFYMFAKFPQIDDSECFARWLLTDFDFNGETVMIAPGTGFYQTPGKGKDEIRLAYVLEEEKIIRAVSLLEKGLTKYKATKLLVGAAG